MMTIEDIQSKLKIEIKKIENIDHLEERKPKIIAFYAEKGGVGKTTLCSTLAYTMASYGKRVLLYDCDVQRSLTAWMFGNNIEIQSKINTVNKVDNFIRNIERFAEVNYPDQYCMSLHEQTISISLKPAFALEVIKNLYLVIGSRNLPELDEKIAREETFSSFEFRNFHDMGPNKLSAKPYHAIMCTAQKFKIDYVFLDLNPYPSILNRCLVMASHYLIIPASPDYFCSEMMHMMSRNLNEWRIKIRSIKEATKRANGEFPWPDHLPKFLGYILNIFMSNSTRKIDENLIRMSENNWINQPIGNFFTN